MRWIVAENDKFWVYYQTSESAFSLFFFANVNLSGWHPAQSLYAILVENSPKTSKIVCGLLKFFSSRMCFRIIFMSTVRMRSRIFWFSVALAAAFTPDVDWLGPAFAWTFVWNFANEFIILFPWLVTNAWFLIDQWNGARTNDNWKCEKKFCQLTLKCHTYLDNNESVSTTRVCSAANKIRQKSKQWLCCGMNAKKCFELNGVPSVNEWVSEWVTEWPCKTKTTVQLNEQHSLCVWESVFHLPFIPHSTNSSSSNNKNNKRWINWTANHRRWWIIERLNEMTTADIASVLVFSKHWKLPQAYLTARCTKFKRFFDFHTSSSYPNETHCT